MIHKIDSLPLYSLLWKRNPHLKTLLTLIVRNLQGIDHEANPPTTGPSTDPSTILITAPGTKTKDKPITHQKYMHPLWTTSLMSLLHHNLPTNNSKRNQVLKSLVRTSTATLISRWCKRSPIRWTVCNDHFKNWKASWTVCSRRCLSLRDSATNRHKFWVNPLHVLYREQKYWIRN